MNESQCGSYRQTKMYLLEGLSCEFILLLQQVAVFANSVLKTSDGVTVFGCPVVLQELCDGQIYAFRSFKDPITNLSRPSEAQSEVNRPSLLAPPILFMPQHHSLRLPPCRSPGQSYHWLLANKLRCSDMSGHWLSALMAKMTAVMLQHIMLI